MRRALVVAVVCSAGCGRLGFDPEASGAADAAAMAIAAVGPLACGTSRVIAEPVAMPVGVGLVSTADGVLVVWTTAASARAAGLELDGVQLVVGPDAVTAVHAAMSILPIEATDFGFVSDGAAEPATRFMLSEMVDRGTMFVALDAALQLTASITRLGPMTGHHAVAAPGAPGGAFVAGWRQGGQAMFSALDAAGAPTGTVYQHAADPDPDAPPGVAIQHAAARDVAVWSTGGNGCAIWAFDDTTLAPVVNAPRIYAPGGDCQRSTITRHPSGVNLLVWVANATSHAQLGTDTTSVGSELSVASVAGDLEVATAPSGFFIVVSLEAAAQPSYLRTDGTGSTTLAAVPHVRGAPFRLIEHGDEALLVTVGQAAGQPQLLLTRLCEP